MFKNLYIIVEYYIFMIIYVNVMEIYINLIFDHFMIFYNMRVNVIFIIMLGLYRNIYVIIFMNENFTYFLIIIINLFIYQYLYLYLYYYFIFYLI